MDVIFRDFKLICICTMYKIVKWPYGTEERLWWFYFSCKQAIYMKRFSYCTVIINTKLSRKKFCKFSLKLVLVIADKHYVCIACSDTLNNHRICIEYNGCVYQLKNSQWIWHSDTQRQKFVFTFPHKNHKWNIWFLLLLIKSNR